MIRLYYKGEMSKMNNYPCAYENLIEKIKEIFGSRLPSEFIIKYENLRGNQVLIRDNNEYQLYILNYKEENKKIHVMARFRNKLNETIQPTSYTSSSFSNFTVDPLSFIEDFKSKDPEESTVNRVPGPKPIKFEEGKNDSILKIINKRKNPNQVESRCKNNDFISAKFDRYESNSPISIHWQAPEIQIPIRIKNVGNVKFPKNTVLKSINGISIKNSISIPQIEPNNYHLELITIKSPGKPGIYESHLRIGYTNDQGTFEYISETCILKLDVSNKISTFRQMHLKSSRTNDTILIKFL